MLELPLLMLGVFFMFLKKRKEFYLFFSLLLISPLPSGFAVGNSTWVSRSGFMIFWLYTFIGFGIYGLVKLFSRKRYQMSILLAIILLYVYSASGYLFSYYYDWSRTSSQYYSKQTKDLVMFASKEEQKRNQIIFSGVSSNVFLHYAFYNKLDPGLVQTSINKNPISFKNLTFTPECKSQDLDPRSFIPKSSIYISPEFCYKKTKPNKSIKTDEGTVIWKIYEN